MNKYKEAILPIIKEANAKAFKIAGVLSIVGIALLGLSVGLLEVGVIRIIGVSVGLVLMGLPFILRFFIEQHKKIGVIRFSESELLTKLSGQEQTAYKIKDIRTIEYAVVDYEGETKTKDLIRSSSRMNVRTGAENYVSWKTNDSEFHYNFKLESELAKRKALHFLQSFENQINNTDNKG